MKQIIKFPSNFFWGASTSAHQVEGGNVNDWFLFEKENATRLADEAKNKWEKWQREKFPEMYFPNNYISGKATNHYVRFEEDFDFAKYLGQNAHRFSIEWSRIEPEEGKFDEKAITHYRQVLLALKERKIEPFVTLWHWPIPLWLRGKGGWDPSVTITYFERYVKTVVEALGEDVKYWITLNEPEIYLSHSFWKGEWPPQRKSFISSFSVLINLILAHRSAYKIIKERFPASQVGIAKNNINFQGVNDNIFNQLLTKIMDYGWNKFILNRIRKQQDFIGLNHYFRRKVGFGTPKLRTQSEGRERFSDLGWELHPESMYAVLVGLKKYKKPVYITENGLADRDDENREWFINKSLQMVHKAINEGVDVRGYFYWSLLDNFEWDKGFWPRFGLIEVDYETGERKVRKSALEYKKICEENGMEVG